MGLVNIDIPARTYTIKIIIGLAIFLFGAIGFNLIVSNGKSFNENFQNFWILILFYFVLMFFGWIVFIKGTDKWKELENLEIEKIQLEIKLLKKQIKSKK